MALFLVVGLGNPGPAYQSAWHNLGAAAVRLLARRHRTQLASDPTDALVGRVGEAPEEMALAIPLSGMNDCGPVVRALAEWLDLDGSRRLVVVHDELDLPVGRLKVKVGGGTAGHNGCDRSSPRSGLRSSCGCASASGSL